MTQQALYIDLDGTLIATDLLYESILKLTRVEPLNALKMPLWLFGGKAAFKREIASRVTIDVTTLPYRQEIIDIVKRARADGRRVVLATASDSNLANEVAAHLGLFDAVIASDGTSNFGGRAKLEAIKADSGGKPFVYAGDRSIDLEIWREAAGAVVISRSPSIAERVRSTTEVVAEFDSRRNTLGRYLYGIRLHQWLKNLLVFLPLLPVLATISATSVLRASLAFLAFGLMASSVYIINDLLDLELDRRHSRKKNRPFANGDIPILHGVVLAGMLILSSVILSISFLNGTFALVLGFYFLLTCSYSLKLKKEPIVDVFALAALYTVRIIAGAVATGLALSFWMLCFSLFLFLGLALTKRYVELAGMAVDDDLHLPGRGYRPQDKIYVLASGIAATYSSTLLFSLYLHDVAVASRFRTPELMWVIVPMLLFWSARIWFKAIRGELHDDPVVFAARDRVSQIIVLASGVIVWASTR